MLIDAPERVSVPRPSSAFPSYTSEQPGSSADTPSRADFGDQTGPDWLDRGRLGDALARAAELAGKPLKAEALLAAARLRRWVSSAVLTEELAVLVNAGRLLLEEVPDPARPILARIRVYSAPREADR